MLNLFGHYLWRFTIHPALVLILATVVVAVAQRLFSVGDSASWRRILSAASVLWIVLYAGVALFYLFTVPYFDLVEPAISSVAWNYFLGHPLFHDPDAAARYSMAYGPGSYLVEVASLSVFGPGPFSAKLPFVFAGLASCGLMADALRRKLGLVTSLYVTAALAIAMLGFAPVSFWVRPDPVVLLAVIVGIWCVERMPNRFLGLALGIALGIAVLFKAYAPIFFLPLLIALWRRSGTGGLLPFLIAAIIPAPVVFFLFPRISLANHLHWILMETHQKLDPQLAFLNVEWLILYLCWPVTALYLLRSRLTPGLWVDWAAVILVSCLAALLGSKFGAGASYMLPAAPLIIWKGIDLYTLRRGDTVSGPEKSIHSVAFAGQICAFMILGLAGLFAMGSFFQATRSEAAVRQDLIGLLKQYPGVKAAVGDEGMSRPANNYRWSYFPDAIYRGNPLELETPAVVPMTLTRIPFPPATYDLLEHKFYAVWFFPANAEPFGGFPYSAAFHDAFMRNYQFKTTDGFYDTWVAR